MITKQTFVRILGTLRKNQEILSKFSNDIDNLFNCFCSELPVGKFMDDIIGDIDSEFPNGYETLSWWIYEKNWGEREDFKITETIDGKEVEHDLKTPEELYDYLVDNEKSCEARGVSVRKPPSDEGEAKLKIKPTDDLCEFLFKHGTKHKEEK